MMDSYPVTEKMNEKEMKKMSQNEIKNVNQKQKMKSIGD